MIKHKKPCMISSIINQPKAHEDISGDGITDGLLVGGGVLLGLEARRCSRRAVTLVSNYIRKNVK